MGSATVGGKSGTIGLLEFLSLRLGIGTMGDRSGSVTGEGSGSGGENVSALFARGGSGGRGSTSGIGAGAIGGEGAILV